MKTDISPDDHDPKFRRMTVTTEILSQRLLTSAALVFAALELLAWKPAGENSTLKLETSMKKS